MKDKQTAVIALGANQGDPLSIMQQAVQALADHPHMQIKACSPVYQTPPWGPVEQPDFMNAVLLLDTTLSVNDLFSYLQQLEKKLGRKKTVRWGPRVIDLDLIFFDDLEQSNDTLTLPHPGVYSRPFVLLPLMAIDPTAHWPKIGCIQTYVHEQGLDTPLKRQSTALWPPA